VAALAKACEKGRAESADLMIYSSQRLIRLGNMRHPVGVLHEEAAS
jgi:hypothetical protein